MDYSPYRGRFSGDIVWDYANYRLPELTAEVATNGAVIGYLGSADSWSVLPTLGVEFDFETESIEVRIDRISEVSLVELLHGLYLRFVIVYPPSTGKLKTVNFEDYEAVIEALKTPKSN